MSPRCFIAIATGQNIANVAPLLAVASAQDAIVFIETAEAARHGWVDPAVKVLRGHGCERIERLRLDSDAPARLYEAARAHRWPQGRLVIMGNGGTKPQSMALYEALREHAPWILYSLDRPCRLQWFEHGPGTAPRDQPYGRTPLSLDDVLALRGMRVHTEGEALWSDGRLTDAGQLRAAVNRGYGIEPEETFALHDRHAQHEAERAAAVALPRLPRWQDVLQLAPDEVARYIRAWANALRVPAERLQQRQDDRLVGLFNAAVGVLERTLRPRNLVTAPPPLGTAFEHALVARLCRLLAAERTLAPILQGVWSNVRIGKQNEPGVVLLEADVLVLLKNGLLLAIEAKSHTAENKDLDARLLNLQRAGSQLARTIVCSPLYTAAAGRDWFKTHHEFAQRVRRHGLTHLAYTLPGQASEYSLPALGDEAKPQASYTVPDFETACGRLLRDYLPNSTSGV